MGGMNTQGPTCVKISLSLLISLITLTEVAVAQEGPPREPSEPTDSSRLAVKRKNDAIQDAREALRRAELTRGRVDEKTIGCVLELATLLHEQGIYEKARPLYERALAACEELLGSENPQTAACLLNLASLLGDQSQLGEARPLVERALEIYERAPGPDQVDLMVCLNNLAAIDWQQGRFADARSRFERVLKSLEQTLGADHPQTTTIVFNLGAVIREQGLYDEALPYFRRAVATRERLYGSDHLETAIAFLGLAQVLGILGNNKEARILYERTLRIFEGQLGPDHPYVANTLSSLARILFQQGSYEEARLLHERALRIREAALGSDHPSMAETLSGLGVLEELMGKYEEAFTHFVQALDLYEAAFGPEHPAVGMTLNNVAAVLIALGRFEDARPLLVRSLATHEEVFGPDHPSTADTLNSLGVLLEHLGLSEEARPCLERVVAIYEKAVGPDHPDTSRALFNLGGLLHGLRLHTEARPMLARSVAINEKVLGPDHLETGFALAGLASLLDSLRAYDEARPFFERAIEIFEKKLGPDHPELGLGISQLARTLTMQGDFDSARRLHERAIVILEGSLGAEHLKVGDAALRLSSLLRLRGHFDEAATSAGRALTIRQKTLGPGHPETAHCLTFLAILDVERGERGRALERSKLALRVRERRMDRLLPTLTESERYQHVRGFVSDLEVLLTVARGQKNRPEIDVDTYETVLRWKGRISRIMFRSSSGLVSEEEKAMIGRLRAVQRRLSDSVYKTDVKDLEAHANMIESLRSLRNNLELELVRGQAETGNRPSVFARSIEAEPTLDSVASNLSGGVAVDFLVHRLYSGANQETGSFWTPPQLTAWVVRPGKSVQRVELGEASTIENATRTFLRELVESRGLSGVDEKNQAGRPSISKAARRLRELLWDPLAELIGDSERVFISPDSFLGTLPLEVMQREDGSYLLEHHAFVYGRDLASLSRLVDTEWVPRDGVLVCGGIDYNNRIDLPAGKAQVGDTRGSFRSRWSRLRASASEADSIVELHELTREKGSLCLFLEKSAATEERLKEEMPNHGIIHLATHGYFQPEGLPSMWEDAPRIDEDSDYAGMRNAERRITGLLPGLLSGLVFAGANFPPEAGRDNGLLTAEEVTFIDLSRCELVVLSACETGLGRPESGQGMIGLRRSFRMAGARTVISSLWSVKDEATSELMTMFYENLWLKKMGKLSALRTAQLEMLKRNRAEYGEGLPSTWGAFVLDGEWR